MLAEQTLVDPVPLTDEVANKRTHPRAFLQKLWTNLALKSINADQYNSLVDKWTKVKAGADTKKLQDDASGLEKIRRRMYARRLVKDNSPRIFYSFYGGEQTVERLPNPDALGTIKVKMRGISRVEKRISIGGNVPETALPAAMRLFPQIHDTPTFETSNELGGIVW